MNLEDFQAERVGELRLDAGVQRGRGESRLRNVVAFKFGGSSLLGAERMLHAARLVHAETARSSLCVVVSAMRGVTDRLLGLANRLLSGKEASAGREAEGVLELHLEVLGGLELEEGHALRVGRELQLLGQDLRHEVGAYMGGRGHEPERIDRVASFGERFSARLFAAALEKCGVAAVPVASPEFVLTCDTFRNAVPHLAETKQRGSALLVPLLEQGIVPVVTGFIGATPDGRITTLGRNSSDFSGAIVAHVVEAEELVIWTDVDGIYTENPHTASQARLLEELSYEAAHALASCGARVLHHKVLPLAEVSETVVWVKNTFHPEARGTRIGPARKLSVSQSKEGAA